MNQSISTASIIGACGAKATGFLELLREIRVDVADRSALTLEPLILEHILPGTHIMSDGWAAYRNLSEIGNGIYQLSVVVHEHNFVNPDYPDTHTQNIENLWMRAKRKLRRQFGTSTQLFPSYLMEFQFRQHVRQGQCFAYFMTVLAENYPV